MSNMSDRNPKTPWWTVAMEKNRETPVTAEKAVESVAELASKPETPFEKKPEQRQEKKAELKVEPKTEPKPESKNESSGNEFDITTLRVQRNPSLQNHAPLQPAKSVAGRNRRNVFVVAAAVLAVIGWFLYPHPVAVDTTSVTMVYPSQQYALLNATGYVVPQLKAAVASKGTGRLEWLGVAEGSHVKKDEVIARLESRDVQASFDSALANVSVARVAVESAFIELKNANQALERTTSLYSKGFMSRVAVDDALARQRQANTAVTSARASLDMAEANASNAEVAVDYTLIRAPFDGVILSKSANVGDIVTPMSSAADSKGAVVTMADMNTLEVEADVSESSLALIKVDQPCAIMLDSIPGIQFRGVVSRIVPTIDRAKATVMTKVRFIDTDPRILPDMSAKVSFLSQSINPQQQQAVMAVNSQAVVERDGKHTVFAVSADGADSAKSSNRAKAIEIVAETAIGDLTPIRGALKAGDTVVLNPGRMTDGEKLKIANDK
ncbi:MAG: efflux RND transporter periplasmic adaptor subunit [Spongiibacteraceae bacterium]